MERIEPELAAPGRPDAEGHEAVTELRLTLDLAVFGAHRFDEARHALVDPEAVEAAFAHVRAREIGQQERFRCRVRQPAALPIEHVDVVAEIGLAHRLAVVGAQDRHAARDVVGALDDHQPIAAQRRHQQAPVRQALPCPIDDAVVADREQLR